MTTSEHTDTHSTDTPASLSAALEERNALRADVYLLLARLVREPPNAELLEFLSALEPDDENSALKRHWASLSLAAQHAHPGTLHDVHFGLLIGVIQGQLVPYASWYLTGSLMEMPLVALRHDLKHLGFERAAHVKEPEDHFSAMCEVMAMLIESQAEAQAVFFKRHLSPWVLRFMRDLAQVEDPFYASVGALGDAFLSREDNQLQSEPDAQVVTFSPTPSTLGEGAKFSEGDTHS
ncbi:TorD/DmsD family molecular chaperone [Chromohalobacter canadensis]|uniref:Molecular chaperone TorD family protein n=1 Tax=Chromohalobacter canadensis TaxID=141389 RepID=A0ABZ0YBR9_9GAMM|nr:molecular chaperone TorD family protein [Chromohalobacter canadensis]MCK0768665.1 molecular chaperone TorD family protein [Chromohalobacter canadensis]MCT8469739.1 molecular chaperone TorD family protein [Chromohalobacter canadensis]MCT8472426.1 molecular chaperone TorD family protein [Chromohalobacter canadensis]MCT8499461.1 molecular chaperone TorD family protein [Chromohalobacter canadensis]WQH09168.1 molecular chaperone TorD family protein [Chromohalobacter canadensis]